MSIISFIALHADEIEYAKQQIQEFIMSGHYDFLGFRGEQLYFQLQGEYAKGCIPKIIYFDIKTLLEQSKLSLKCFYDNDLIYMCFGGFASLTKIKGFVGILKLLR